MNPAPHDIKILNLAGETNNFFESLYLKINHRGGAG